MSTFPANSEGGENLCRTLWLSSSALTTRMEFTPWGLEESEALEKLASLAKHGRYKKSIIEDARLKLEKKP
jgi:hypothetical protein